MTSMYSGAPLAVSQMRPNFTAQTMAEAAQQTSAGPAARLDSSSSSSSSYMDITGYSDTPLQNPNSSVDVRESTLHGQASAACKTMDRSVTSAKEKRNVKQEGTSQYSCNQQVAGGSSHTLNPPSLLQVPSPDTRAASPKISNPLVKPRISSFGEVNRCKNENSGLSGVNVRSYTISNVEYEALQDSIGAGPSTSLSAMREKTTTHSQTPTPTHCGITHAGSHFMSNQQSPAEPGAQSSVFSRPGQASDHTNQQYPQPDQDFKKDDDLDITNPLGYAYVLRQSQYDPSLYEENDNYIFNSSPYHSGASQSCSKEDKIYSDVYNSYLQHHINSAYDNNPMNHLQLSPSCLSDKTTSTLTSTTTTTNSSTMLVNPMTLLAQTEECDEDGFPIDDCDDQERDPAEFSSLDLSVLQDPSQKIVLCD